jgi:hypothetical protein
LKSLQPNSIHQNVRETPASDEKPRPYSRLVLSSPDPLPAAIDQLYIAFASVRRPTTIDWCHHCRSESDVAGLLDTTPLRKLSAEALQRYAAHVLTTIGGIADFRYFLPRILEIACTGGFTWPDLELLTGRLDLASWTTWTPEETAAIRALFHALWSKTLTAYPGDPDAHSTLNAIGNAGSDLAPYLQEWTASLTRPPSAARLLDLLRYSDWRLDHTAHRASAHVQDHQMQIAQWANSTELRIAVVEAFATADTEPQLQTLADIDEVLTWYPQLQLGDQ